MSLDQVLAAVADARSLRVVFLDASRNNPFATAGKDVGHGSALDAAAEGTVVAYATSPGGVVADSGGANGAYAMALAKHLVEPKVEIEMLFRIVRDEVLRASEGKQQPFVYCRAAGQGVLLPPLNMGALAPAHGAEAAPLPGVIASHASRSPPVAAYMPVVRNSVGLVPKKRRKTFAK